ncbi:MAG: hypothetical protein MN733_02510, partial [Nitrososphaera sp.]|nr:hypothetical protein [Nitrososphaera sp.]
MPLTNVLKKPLIKGESIQPGTFRWAASGLILSMTAYASIASATTRGSTLVVGIVPQAFQSWGATQKQRLVESGAHSIRVGRHGDLVNEDDAIRLAEQNGMSVLLMAGYSRGISGITTSAAARQQYADMALADVNKFGTDVIKYVEVWNEWNGGLGLGCKYGNPPCNDGALYTDLLCKVYNTVKRVHPGITIIGGATAGVDI